MPSNKIIVTLDHAGEVTHYYATESDARFQYAEWRGQDVNCRLVLPVTVKIENTYEDGHESVKEVVVDGPDERSEDELEIWWEDEVFPHTGDGHGEKHPKLGVLYEATVLRAGDESLVGLTMEWDG